MSRITSRASGSGTAAPRPGFWGGLVLGASLGLVWTPCAGPILASVLALAATSTVDFGSVLIMTAYAVGTAVPMLGIMIGGRDLLERFKFLKRHGEAIQRVFGGLMIVTGILIVTGWDRQFQNAVLSVLPQYGSGLTQIENQTFIQKALTDRSAALGATGLPGSPYAALSLGGTWINSKPLTPADLKGKTVLIDFWTYSCINCIRTFPYLKAWDERYRDRGLLIIGVHTPEFAFEKETDNVRRAARDFGLRYAIVQDNDYKIWQAFNNHYWPADFLFDGGGRLVDTHYGEGDYDKTEALIQKLTGRTGALAAASIAATLPTDAARTPETYLGYGRADRFDNPAGAPRDTAADFAAPASLAPDHWALTGKWTHEQQDVRAEGPGKIALSFRASKIYLVLGPAASTGAGKAIVLKVTVNGAPAESRDIKHGVLTVDGYRLYVLYDGSSPTRGLVVVETAGPVKAYVFTFG